MSNISMDKASQNSFHTNLKKMNLWVLLLFLAVSTLYCTPPEPDPYAGYRFVCTRSRTGWQLCNQNRVRYCHIDHYHTGQNCEKQHLECFENSEKTAVCIDKTKSCQTGESKCEQNIAHNCVNGYVSDISCGTAKTCKMKNNQAFCEYKVKPCGENGELHDGKCECNTGYQIDPKNARNCIPT